MESRHTVIAKWLFVFLVLAMGCHQNVGRRQVVFVLADALRPDRLSCYGYHRQTSPELDALARQGLVFEQHFAQATHTRTSLPLLLYSRYFSIPIFPLTGAVPFSEPENLFLRVDDEAVSLPRALSRSGMKTAMISAHSWLRKETPLATEFDEFYDLTVLLSDYRGAPSAAQAVEYTLEWLEKNTNNDFLLYLHLMDPHAPLLFSCAARGYFGDAPPPVDRFTPNGHPIDTRGELSPLERRYFDALYDGAVTEMDTAIGRLTTFLRENGRLDSTLIVVTSDHGEHLMHVPGRLGHAGAWYDQVARVPLIIHFPSRVQPHRIRGITESVDIFPTIMDLLDVELEGPWNPDGSSLMTIAHGEQDAKEYAFGPRAIRGHRYKAIFHDSEGRLLANPRPPAEDLRGELYDLLFDPLETQNLWELEPQLGASLLERYQEHLRLPYERHRSTRTDEQPVSPFAVSVQDIDLHPSVPAVSRVLEDFSCAEIQSDLGWIRSRHWDRYFLAAAPQALPIEVSLSIPNGRYLLSAQALGDATFIPDESSSALEITGAAESVRQLRRTDISDVGVIEITQERLRGVLRPITKSECFVVRYFSFVPLREGVEVQYEEDLQRLENLRALGYLE